ncbi:MAG: hypothetical protein Q7T83_00150 [Thermodesulfovibrionales bacterium]|nr:hypothetical protein [Thermodesulfovibrionales bacterium]
MDIEFHYYITYILALKAGFKNDEAYKIAYSSQFVDDNTTEFKISQKTADAYSNYISQTSDITKPEKNLMRIYPAFHFMPGKKEEIEQDSAMRRDGKFHILNTMQDNSNSRTVLKEAFNTKDLYRIGIATHMYADTFAHQNFVGYYESCNAKIKGETLLEKIIPNIGHADFQHNPDRPANIWPDTRLIRKNSEIDNKARFLKAAERIFEHYRLYLDPQSPKSVIDQEKGVLIKEIEKEIGDHDSNNEEMPNRIARYKEFIKDINNGEFIEYEENAWFNETIDKNFIASIPLINGWGTYKWKAGHKETNWYGFQEAVKAHQWFVMENIINPITANLELEKM